MTDAEFESILTCADPEHMGEHACQNRAQCWEPCGELGKSEEHARVVKHAETGTAHASRASDRILAIDPEEKIARRKAQLKAAQDRYREKHRDALNAKQREARKADPAKQAKRMRDYRAKKPPGIAATESKRVRPAGYRQAFNAYRAKWASENRDKLSEYAHKRSQAKLKKLPSGTLARIGEQQKWKCAACHVSLKKRGYHKDHIVPLAAGGLHEPSNIQLLCPTCNLQKGAKDAIDFMRGKGFLL